MDYTDEIYTQILSVKDERKKYNFIPRKSFIDF